MAGDSASLILDDLTQQLTELLEENRILRERASAAASTATRWPDMSRATKLFVDAQPPYCHLG